MAGISINSNGGAYLNGTSYGILKKFELVDKYDELRFLTHGVPPSFCQLAIAAQVSQSWAQKVIGELQSQDGLVDSDLARAERLKGPGSWSLDSFDIAVLLQLQRIDSSRSLLTPELPARTLSSSRSIVSRSTISHMFFM